MKRGGPLQRRTPLKAKKGLERGAPLSRRAALSAGRPSKSQPIKVRRPRAKIEKAVAGAIEQATWSEVRLVIYVRAGGRCEVCDCQLNVHVMQGHHRRRRGIKGRHRHCPCNAIAVCPGCHEKIHKKPEQSRDQGRIVSALAEGLEPGDVPVKLHRGEVLLTCGGTYLQAS